MKRQNKHSFHRGAHFPKQWKRCTQVAATVLKGTPSKDTSCPENYIQAFPFLGFKVCIVVIYQYSCNKSTVLLDVFNLNSSRHSWAMLVHFLLAKKIRKRLSHDVTYIYSSATYASPIYVVAGTVCLTQNGCAHGCAFAAFKLWSLTSNAKTPLADLEKCRKQWSSHFE